MSNINSLCEHSIVILRLPCLFKMANAVSSTIELDDLVTSDSVHSFKFAM